MVCVPFGKGIVYCYNNSFNIITYPPRFVKRFEAFWAGFVPRFEKYWFASVAQKLFELAFGGGDKVVHLLFFYAEFARDLRITHRLEAKLQHLPLAV